MAAARLHLVKLAMGQLANGGLRGIIAIKMMCSVCVCVCVLASHAYHIQQFGTQRQWSEPTLRVTPTSGWHFSLSILPRRRQHVQQQTSTPAATRTQQILKHYVHGDARKKTGISTV